MYKILLLYKGNSSIRSFQESLKKKGYTFTKAQTLKDAFSCLKKSSIDLIVVDKNFSTNTDSFKKFIKLTKFIPKIVTTSDNNLKGMGHLLNSNISAPVLEPVSYRKFQFLVTKLIKDKLIREENQELQAMLKIINKELRFLKDITNILTLSVKLNKILTAIVKKTSTIIGAESGSIFFVDEDKGELFFEKRLRGKTKKIKMRLDEDIEGWVAKEGLPVIAPDATKDVHFKGKIDKLLHRETRSIICIPIKIKDKVIGILEFVNKVTGEPFTKTDLDLVNQAAMAIEQAFLYQKMEELTITDDLTNLFNLRYLNRAIELEIDRSNRFGLALTLIFMDIDFFKKINDKHGHLIGSKILAEMAHILLRNLRTIDIVARYGGDEFVIALPQTSLSAGFDVAERLRKAVEKHVFLKHEGYSFKITASFGVASYPENAKTKEDLLHIADKAMYRAKFSTRNIVYSAT